MKELEEYETTTNRYLYNKIRKQKLERHGEIRCSYCKYNRGENGTTKTYGGYPDRIRYPSWKLTSKNPKQWMKKKVKKVNRKSWRIKYSKYIDMIF